MNAQGRHNLCFLFYTPLVQPEMYFMTTIYCLFIWSHFGEFSRAENLSAFPIFFFSLYLLHKIEWQQTI